MLEWVPLPEAFNYFKEQAPPGAAAPCSSKHCQMRSGSSTPNTAALRPATYPTGLPSSPGASQELPGVGETLHSSALFFFYKYILLVMQVESYGKMKRVEDSGKICSPLATS